MELDPTEIRQLRQIFAEEMQEKIPRLEADLAELQGPTTDDQRRGLLSRLMRHIHSLKGAARTVDLDVLAELLHKSEDVLTDLTELRIRHSERLFVLLGHTIGSLQDSASQLRREHDISDTTLLAHCLRELTAFADSEGGLGSAGLGSASLGSKETEPAAGIATSLEAEDRPTRIPQSKTMRVSATQLDNLVEHIGELLTSHRRLESRGKELRQLHDLAKRWREDWSVLQTQLEKQINPQTVAGARINALLSDQSTRLQFFQRVLGQLANDLSADNRSVGQVCDSIDDDVQQIRMVPFAEACNHLERAARDVAQQLNKQVALTVIGGEVLADRSLVDALRDPLLHLVRNAVDHGIEPPAERRALGKNAVGSIRITACICGPRLEVSVTDDGRGLNLKAIREQAQQSEYAGLANDDRLAELVFEPGFSTLSQVTGISGRGVGLDVVKSRIEGLNGSVELEIQEGCGAQILMHVPLTTTPMQIVPVETDGQWVGLPAEYVVEIVEIERSALTMIDGQYVLSFHEQFYPVADLGALFAGTPPWQGTALSSQSTQKLLVAVLACGEQRAAVAIEQVGNQLDVVVQGFGTRVRRARFFVGATALPDLGLVLVVNTPHLMGLFQDSATRPIPSSVPWQDSDKAKRLLLADGTDGSGSAGTSVAEILRSAGFEVITATNGTEAWQLLQDDHFDLFLADIEVPGIDGYELTRRIRHSQHLSTLPVVLLAPANAPLDRMLAQGLGASMCLSRSRLEKDELFAVVAKLTSVCGDP